MVGREDGVGMELEVLVVAVVLTLLRPSVDTESRDCGRRMPVGIMLCESALPARLLLMDEGESNELVDIGRKAVGAPDGGLDVRLRSLSLSFEGEGESSMMSTQPDVSAFPGVRLFSASKSTLCRRDLGWDFGIVAKRSSWLVDRDEEAVDGAGEAELLVGTGGGGIALAAVRLVTLPIRSLGTRVWIFCSRILTRARISDTIWTPLLLDAVELTPVVVLAVLAARAEAVRVEMGRETGVRGGCSREGLAESPGCVAERAREAMPLLGVETPFRDGNPARCNAMGGVTG